MKKYEISEDLLGNLARYLATRPWQEVNPLLIALQEVSTKEIKEAKTSS